jgi:RNA polymerase sigma factor for flagellar operon FliA
VNAPDPDAREATIRALLPLVRQVARRVLRVAPSADLDDLVGDGALGLIRAVDGFDPTRGVTLAHYARRLIVGAMLNGLRRADPVSERVRRTMRRVEARRYALAQERGAMPTYAELERDDPNVRSARIAAYERVPLSLDGPLSGVAEALVERRAEPARVAVERARRATIRAAVARLPERQQCILAMHYVEELPLRAIGRHLDVSAQRVSQLHQSALARLRATLPPP